MSKRWDLRSWYSIPSILFIVYLVLDVLAVVAGLRLAFPVYAQGPTPNAAALEDRAKDLESLLTALATVGTIFGLALGVGTYVNLRDTQTKAEDALDEIRSDFPAIASLNRKIRAILNDLRSYGDLRLEHLDEDSYGKISPTQREEIQVREMTFSAVDFFDFTKVAELQNLAAEGYVTFAHFYGARYMSDPKLYSSALLRALLYLERAREFGDGEVATRVRTAFGVLYVWQYGGESDPVEKQRILTRAKQNLNAVLKEHEFDARCLLALAWVERHEGHMDAAIRNLDKLIQAAKDNKLTDHQKNRFLEKAYYNRACYRTLSGDKDSAVSDLRLSRSLAKAQGHLPKWIKEMEKDPDLKSLESPDRQALQNPS